MNKEIAKAAIQFLERTELRWNEVPAYTQVIEALVWMLQEKTWTAEIKD